MSAAAETNPYRDDDRDLDDLTVSELEMLLADAETALQRVRMELHERVAEQHSPEERLTAQQVDELLPGPNLVEYQGRWVDFLRFFREMMNRTPQ